MQKIDPFNKMDITRQINLFRNFLIAAWPSLDSLMDNHDWEDDGMFTCEWLQVNWEFLVEREILGKNGSLTEFSVLYSGKRVTEGINPVYSVIAKPQKNITVYDLKKECIVPFSKDLRLFGFYTFKDGGYGIYPPFELAALMLNPKEIFVVPIQDLNFYLKILL